jgi:hypothetical protein
MNARKLVLTLLVFIQSINAFCQAPPREFFDGLKMMTTDQPGAKSNFLTAIQKDSSFYGSYHFMGVICLNENKPDSAIWYFKKSIALNSTNASHTKEMAYARLITTYTNQQDFQEAFATAWECANKYPDNTDFTSSLRDICLWSFYIKDDHLNPSYLSPNLKDEYIVTSIAQEYLILRNLRVNDEYLSMSRQSLVTKKGASYDVFNCTLSKTKKEVTVNFKINWDMNMYYGGNTAPQKPVIDDKSKPVYERVGAMLIFDSKTGLKEAIQKLMN